MSDLYSFIVDLANKYAAISIFKSDFPHHEKSVVDGFIEGFKAAIRILNSYKPNADKVQKMANDLSPTDFNKWFNEKFYL